MPDDILSANAGSLAREKTSDEIKLAASQKVYIEATDIEGRPLRVPFREIELSPS
jgi:hypothetical protein